MNYIVYVAESKSGKKYVGMTKSGLRTRMLQHIRLAKNDKTKRIFQNALKKYSYEFNWSVLASGLSLDKAELLEKQMIAIWNTTNRKYGYNQAVGGMAGNIMTKEARQRWKDKMREKYKDKNYLKKMSDITKSRMDSNPQIKKKTSEFFKKYYSIAENKQRNRDHLDRIKDDHNFMAKRNKSMGGFPFICNETKEIFGSLRECAEMHNTMKVSVYKVLKNKRKQNNGKTYSYVSWEYYQEVKNV
jgi:hypothetical protein